MSQNYGLEACSWSSKQDVFHSSISSLPCAHPRPCRHLPFPKGVAGGQYPSKISNLSCTRVPARSKALRNPNKSSFFSKKRQKSRINSWLGHSIKFILPLTLTIHLFTAPIVILKCTTEKHQQSLLGYAIAAVVVAPVLGFIWGFLVWVRKSNGIEERDLEKGLNQKVKGKREKRGEQCLRSSVVGSGDFADIWRGEEEERGWRADRKNRPRNRPKNLIAGDLGPSRQLYSVKIGPGRSESVPGPETRASPNPYNQRTQTRFQQAEPHHKVFKTISRKPVPNQLANQVTAAKGRGPNLDSGLQKTINQISINIKVALSKYKLRREITNRQSSLRNQIELAGDANGSPFSERKLLSVVNRASQGQIAASEVYAAEMRRREMEVLNQDLHAKVKRHLEKSARNRARTGPYVAYRASLSGTEQAVSRFAGCLKEGQQFSRPYDWYNPMSIKTGPEAGPSVSINAVEMSGAINRPGDKNASHVSLIGIDASLSSENGFGQPKFNSELAAQSRGPELLLKSTRTGDPCYQPQEKIEREAEIKIKL